MKPLLWLCVGLAVCVGVQAQSSGAVSQSHQPLFSPSNMFWGYGQFDVAPPHNEIDPNLCRADSGNFGGVNASCTAFARYMISGYVEFRPFATTQLRRLFFFGQPRFL